MAEQIKYDIRVDGIKGTVTDLNELNLAMAKVKQTLSATTVGTTQYTRALRELGQLSKTELRMTSTALTTVATGANSSSIALQNLNFVLRDSPYFFKDFQLGVLAVGNNLNPLIDSMIRLNKEAKAVNQTLGQALMASLKGGGGIIIAMSLFVTALQAVTFAMSKTKEEASETKEKIHDLREEIKELSYETLITEESKAKTELDLFMGTTITKGSHLSSAEKESNRQTLEGRAYWQKRLDFIQRELILMGEEEQITRRIKENENKRKQLNQATYNAIVPQATSLENARQILNDMIRADQKQLDLWKGKTNELKEQLRITSELNLATVGALGVTEIPIDQYHKQEYENRQKFFESLKWRLGYEPEEKKYDLKHPLEGLQKGAKESTSLVQELAREAKTMGDVLADAFMRGAKAADIFNAIASKVLSAFLNFVIGGAISGATGGAALGVVAGASSLGKQSNGGSNINITGELSAKQDKFIIEFDKARTKVYDSRRINLVS